MMNIHSLVDLFCRLINDRKFHLPSLDDHLSKIVIIQAELSPHNKTNSSNVNQGQIRTWNIHIEMHTAYIRYGCYRYLYKQEWTLSK